jgi:hypothetical protein
MQKKPSKRAWTFETLSRKQLVKGVSLTKYQEQLSTRHPPATFEFEKIIERVPVNSSFDICMPGRRPSKNAFLPALF